MASRIRELKDQLVNQTEQIVTLRNERDKTKDAAKNLHIMLVRYKPSFHEAVNGEVGDYPNLRAEDVSKMSTADMLSLTVAALGAITKALQDASVELKDMYKELDQSVDDALENWRVVRAQEDSTAKATIFRDPSVGIAKEKRAATPELPLVDRPRTDSVVSSLQAMAGTKKKETPKPTKQAPKKASSAAIADVMASPTSAAPKDQTK